jgi:hypothetical protein
MAKIYSIIFCIFLILSSCHSRISEDGVIANPETTPRSDTKLVIDTVKGVPEVVEVYDTVTSFEEVKQPKPITGEPTATTPSITEVYISQVGVGELTGHNDGPDVEKYLKSVGLKKGYAWCAAYVKWCYDQAKIKTTMNGAAASAHNNNNLVLFKHKFIKDPEAGDAFTLWYSNLNRIGHTGFFHKKVNSSIFESYEGNTGEGSAIDVGTREGDGVYHKYRSFNATYSISRWKK